MNLNTNKEAFILLIYMIVSPKWKKLYLKQPNHVKHKSVYLFFVSAIHRNIKGVIWTVEFKYHLTHILLVVFLWNTYIYLSFYWITDFIYIFITKKVFLYYAIKMRIFFWEQLYILICTYIATALFMILLFYTSYHLITLFKKIKMQTYIKNRQLYSSLYIAFIRFIKRGLFYLFLIPVSLQCVGFYLFFLSIMFEWYYSFQISHGLCLSFVAYLEFCYLWGTCDHIYYYYYIEYAIMNKFFTKKDTFKRKVKYCIK